LDLQKHNQVTREVLWDMNAAMLRMLLVLVPSGHAPEG
jgi:hypothetical protein